MGEFLKIDSDKFLSGNPIVLTIDNYTIDEMRFRIIDLKDNAEVYTGRVHSNSRYMIANVPVNVCIKNLFTQEKITDGVGKYRIELICGVDEIADRSVFEVYPGTISKGLYRFLKEKNTDIFAAKLTPADKNFLLSTRSFGQYISVPENELLPIPYYKKGKKFSIYADRMLLESHDYSTLDSELAGYIDVQALRRKALTEFGFLPSVIDIVGGDSTAVTTSVIVTQAVPRAYFIKFLNSFGAWEKVGIDDMVNFTPEVEIKRVVVYDTLIGGETSKHSGSAFAEKYKASITGKSAPEMTWIMDMLLSCEQYFITPRGEFKALITAESPTLQSTDGVPRQVGIVIELAEKDSAFSPDISNADNMMNRIFTEQFSLQFK